MKILIDIGHPAHVHYFRNAIKILQSKGHEILITTRDKEVTLDLLKGYGLPYICTGKNKKGTLKKIFSMVRNDFAIYKAAKKFNPDLFLSFFSPFAAQVGAFMKKPVIGFTDTEFAKMSIRLTLPFTDHVFTPHCFTTDFGNKHFRFKGYMEHFYLHEKYFSPDRSILQQIGLSDQETYYIMRFVSFNAGHDAGESGIDNKSKVNIARLLSEKNRLFISSEDELPKEFEKFRISLPPQKFHDLLAFSSLYIGEGITTASECALLGVPTILINTLSTSYIDEHEKNGLVYRFPDATKALGKITELYQDQSLRETIRNKSKMVSQSLIDCTAFTVWMVENYPESIHTLRENPSILELFGHQKEISSIL
jgi:predicted glycosyltransferase